MSKTQLSVSRTVEVSAGAIFDVLASPNRHPDLDGSGMVVSAATPERLTEVGQKFTMNMHWDKLGGDYQTDNYVNELVPNRRLGWLTADAGTDPAGWSWLWEFEPDTPDRTVVSLTYDWSRVSDPAVLARVKFPVVSRVQLEKSLVGLAAAL